ncbi:MAG: GHKL domain-containing protein [Eubacteriales bacterium]|nr:GHKL domain-containing protein [Eubacteriales bacterium]
MKHLKQYKRFFALAFVCFLAVALMLIGNASLKHREVLENDATGKMRTVTAVIYEAGDGQRGVLSLPGKLVGLEPRTEVTLSAMVQAQPGESLLVKSVFAPLHLYVNGTPLYEYGQEGSYPAYMNDPPTGLAIVKLPESSGEFSLRVEYESLTQRDTLSLPAFYAGDNAALLERLFKSEGFSLLFSLILILLGTAMTLVSLTFVRNLPSGTSFLWLELFSLSAGIWVFGECDLSAFLLPYPALLYAMAYAGLFCMAIPFLRFGLIILNPQSKLPFGIMLWVHYASVAGAFLLQLTGLMDFTRSLYWFHIITPLGFVTFAVCLVWEHFRHHNPAARRFAPAVLLLAASTVLEVINYWLNLTVTLTLFFQLGVLAFVISLGIVSGYYVRESMRNAAERNRLEYEMRTLERQLYLQRLQYQRIAENEKLIKAQRHDLRHQLAVLRSLTSDEQKLNEYIDRLVENIPSGGGVRFCENYSVNAVAVYYCAMAKQAGIDISVVLTVPQELDGAAESDLCVLVGNLMENAVEACGRIESGKRFIRINSGLEHGILTLTADNSFTGRIRKQDNAFLSSKRPGEGTGISSVTAVAKKYGGNARFEENDGVFQDSVYLRLGEQIR